MNRRILFLATLTLTILSLTLAVMSDLFAYSLDAYREGEIIAEVRNKILSYYVEEVRPEELLEGALQGMTSKLDEYSAYLNEEDYRQLFEGTSGEFIGIGIEITVEEGFLTIIAPIADSPAAEAGILAGDKIIAIDGKSAEGISLNEAVQRLRGEEGTKVTLKVIHEGEKVAEEITIVRQQIQVTSIKDGQLVDYADAIGYIRLVKFNQQSSVELSEEIERLADKGMEKLILDLRFNPGGLLTAAVNIVDLFISKGVIVYTKGRTSGSHQTYQATSSTTIWERPVVVLINGASASASEIVAGALQDYHRAIVVGSKSYGKGSVQSILPLKDEKTGLKLTTAKYYTPSGRSIQKEPGFEGGIFPDVLQPLSQQEQKELAQWLYSQHRREKPQLQVDKQLEKAISVLKEEPTSYKFR